MSDDLLFVAETVTFHAYAVLWRLGIITTDKD